MTAEDRKQRHWLLEDLPRRLPRCPDGALFADATNVLKRLFDSDVPQNLATRERVLLTKMTKKDDFAGDDMSIPLRLQNPQAAGPNPLVAYATTFTGGTMANAYKRFLLTKFDCFNSVKLDRKAIMAARSKGKGAFVDLLEDATSGMLDELGAVASRWLYGDGTAQIGSRGSISTETVTLAIAGDAKNFFAGQQLVVYNGAGISFRTIAAASGNGGIYVTVASVDEENGKFTLTTGDAAAVASFADGDYFAPAGVTASYLAYPGLAGWLPLATPSATTFYGLDRTVDPTRLAGVRLDNSTGSIEDNIMTVAERIKNVGKKHPGDVFLNPTNFTTLEKSVDGKHIYGEGTKTADVGFERIRIMTSGGPVMVHADPDCPTNRGYVIDLASWAFHHMGGFPHLVDDGGGQLMQPIDATNSVLIKARSTAPGVQRPARNGVFSI
jgi:hypothetical protein